MSGKTYDFMAFIRFDHEDEDRLDTVDLRYETAMPSSVLLFTRTGIRRFLSRDVIHSGMYGPSGSDELPDPRIVVVSPEGTEFVEFRLFHEGEFVNILINRGDLLKALDDMGRMVPLGREEEFVDWPTGLARCQKASDR
jgi:hypothetical protein